MKKLLSTIVLFALFALSSPKSTFAAGGISASGGGTKTVGQSFTITVTASGAEFDSLQGTISVSGPVDVGSLSPGGATWLPGKTPSNGGQFVGIASPTSSLTVATIKLKGKSAGVGSVTISGVKLARNGTIVGTGGGSTSFTIQKAPELPGAVQVASSSHPDQNTAYEATAIALSWNKEAGVDNFSYLLDQVADTTPPAKATDANISVTYPDKAIGIYYFHIRAHKSDGWGATTHFKITIKEPDAKVDPMLSAPKNIQIKKTDSFVNSITDGTVTGLIISGTTEPGFTVNLTLTPAPTIPEGKKLSALADSTGKFEVLLDYLVVAGFHKLTVQGQKEKVLTPVSDSITFEISQANGGKINILTSADENTPVVAPTNKPSGSWYKNLGMNIAYYIGIGLIILIALGFILFKILRKRKAKNLLKNIQSKNN